MKNRQCLHDLVSEILVQDQFETLGFVCIGQLPKGPWQYDINYRVENILQSFLKLVTHDTIKMA